MKRLVYMASLALLAMLVLAPGAMAQQMKGQHTMPDGTIMDNAQMMGGNTMASPSASASATPSATGNGRMTGGNMTATPSPSASASTSASASASATASPTATSAASAPRGHHHGDGRSSASATAGARLPSTGGISPVAVGVLALLAGTGLAAAGLMRRRT